MKNTKQKILPMKISSIKTAHTKLWKKTEILEKNTEICKNTEEWHVCNQYFTFDKLN